MNQLNWDAKSCRLTAFIIRIQGGSTEASHPHTLCMNILNSSQHIVYSIFYLPNLTADAPE